MSKMIVLAVCASLLIQHAQGAATKAATPAAGDEFRPAADRAMEQATTNALPWLDFNRFSFQLGVSFITDSSIDELGSSGGGFAEGEAEGEIYLMQVSYKLAELNPQMFGRHWAIDLELPLVLGVVHEHERQPFLQPSIGVTVRWKTFPWNHKLYTNLETGGGFTYSQRVLTAERERHPSRDRSHLEFYWPIQVMLAHPRHREHQMVLFLHHHSGGTIFHRGGANSLGIGYRYVPGERSSHAED